VAAYNAIKEPLGSAAAAAAAEALNTQIIELAKLGLRLASRNMPELLHEFAVRVGLRMAGDFQPGLLDYYAAQEALPKASTDSWMFVQKERENFRSRLASATAAELARPVLDARETPRLDAGDLIRVLSLHPDFLTDDSPLLQTYADSAPAGNARVQRLVG